MNRITRLAVLLCAALLMTSLPARSFTLNTSPTTEANVTGLWWNPNESGWGAALTQQSSIIFVTMFTYDDSGNATWYVASSCNVAGNGCTGDLYRVSGGHSPVVPWAGSNLNATRAGTVTLAFIDNDNGSMSYSIDGRAGTKTITRQLFGPSPPPVSDNRSKTQQLIGGTWAFVYTIISTFVDTYQFTTLSESTARPGDWNAFGTDAFGGTVIGGYSSLIGQWSVLNPGIIIDQYYTFTFSDSNHVAGCYYQIDPPGTTNLSRCYAMTGSRSGSKAARHADPGQLRIEVQQEGSPGTADPDVIQSYLDARRGLPH